MSPVPVRLESPENRARPKSVIQTAPSAIDQEVGGLDVAVEDAQGMGVLQRVGRLDAQPGDGAEEGPIPMHRPGRRRIARLRRADRIMQRPVGSPIRSSSGAGRRSGTRSAAEDGRPRVCR